MESFWRLMEGHSLELASIGLPVVLLLLNIFVKKTIRVFNIHFLGADLAFCGVSIAGSGVVRLIGVLKKLNAAPGPSGIDPASLASALPLNFLLMFCWAVGWAICLNRGVAASKLQEQQLDAERTHRYNAAQLQAIRKRLTPRIQAITLFSVFIGSVILWLATNYAWYSFR